LAGPASWISQLAAAAEADGQRLRQQLPQRRLVDVAVHRVKPRVQRPQVLQHRRREEVTGVDHDLRRADLLDAGRREAALAPRHVGVGDDRDHGD
jgi:hypothetical protein